MMRAFNEKAKCRKCGCDLATAKYITHNPQEHIFRVCARCGYEWDESPLDAKPTIEEAMREEPAPKPLTLGDLKPGTLFRFEEEGSVLIKTSGCSGFNIRGFFDLVEYYEVAADGDRRVTPLTAADVAEFRMPFVAQEEK